MVFIFVLILFLALWSYIKNLESRIKILESGLHTTAFKQTRTQDLEHTLDKKGEFRHPGDFETVQNLHLHTPVKNAPAYNFPVLTTSTWIAVIGALALLLGIGFFLKFAFDNGWLAPILKVFIGLGVGGLLVILGEIWKQKYPVQAQVLVGGGFAIVYTSVVGWFNYFGLPQMLAVVFVLASSAGCAFAGYRFNSKILVTLGVIGGYLSPIVLSNNQNLQLELFVYLLILSISSLALMWKRFWMELAFVATIGAGSNFVAWYMYFGDKANFMPSLVFILLHLLVSMVLVGLFYYTAKIQNRLDKKSDQYLAVWSALNSVGTAIILYPLLYGQQKELLALAFAAASVIVFIAFTIVDRLKAQLVNYTLALSGFGLAACAAFAYWDGLSAYWALLGLSVVAVCVGLLVNQASLRFSGAVLFIITTILSLFYIHPYGSVPVFLLNNQFILELAVIVVGVLFTFLYNKYVKEPEEKNISRFLAFVPVVVMLVGVSLEIMRNLYPAGNGGGQVNLLLSLWWIGYAVSLFVISHIYSHSYLRKAAVLLGGLAIIKVFLIDSLVLELGYRIVSFITLGVILLSVSFFYQKNKDKVLEIWEG